MASNQATAPSTSLSSPDPASLDAAQQATSAALPFVEWLGQRFSKVAHDLRQGEDAEALERLRHITSELQDFFEYILLIGDLPGSTGGDASLTQDLATYRERLTGVLESVNPALEALDLVELADIIEHEVLTVLQEYRPIHERICETLAAA